MKKKNIQSTIKKVTNQIIKNYQPEKIILFGSAVSGEMREYSDLDLVIIKETKKRFYERIGEVLHFLWTEKSRPATGIDVLVYTPQEFLEMKKNNYFIRDEVIKKGKLLYEKK